MAGEDDIRDPRTLRWVESGISGIPRQREWDVTAVAEVEALRGSAAGELEFRVLADGTVVGDVPPEAVAPLTEGIELPLPYAISAVRQTELEWMVGANEIGSEPLVLPTGIAAASLEVAVPPDGDTLVLVDGEMEPEELPDAEADALRTIEQLGRERHQAFVARADRLEDGRWELTVDPL